MFKFKTCFKSTFDQFSSLLIKVNKSMYNKNVLCYYQYLIQNFVKMNLKDVPKLNFDYMIETMKIFLNISFIMR